MGELGNDTLRGDGGDDQLTGGLGLDTFVFQGAFGRDVVNDWANDQDTLRLDDAMWGGGLSLSQVMAQFGEVVAGSVVFEFSATAIVTLKNFSNLASLSDDIMIF